MKISLLLFAWAAASLGADLASLCADRTATERVYYSHRLETRQPFEETMPASLVERLVREDVKKEAVLARVYGVKITAEMLTAETARIDATTRAPEVLAELKRALGNDPARFARTVARPIVVERDLREKFANDDTLHAPQRRIAEALRARLLQEPDPGARLALLEAEHQGQVQDRQEWVLAPRPAEPSAPTAAQSVGGIYRNAASAQFAPPEKAPGAGEPKSYFEDLPMDLQKVLRAQLRRPGDVSAVIESPQAFQIYLTQARTAESLSAAVFTVRKRSYEDWLAEQPDP